MKSKTYEWKIWGLREESITFLNLHIRGRKTDQYNVGDQKRLTEAGGSLCPVAAMAGYLSSIDWGPNSNEPLFGPDVRGRLTSLVKLASTPNNINSTRIGTHSLRSGCANAMFVAGYDAEAIKLRGRWKSDTFAFLFTGRS